jgi:hypothetical protein
LIERARKQVQVAVAEATKQREHRTLPYSVDSQLEKFHAAGDARIFWKTHGAKFPLLQNVAMRVSCAAPTSTSTERINKMNKTVQSADRASLTHERVVKSLYCYANLRFLNRITEHEDTMVSSLLDELSDDADAPKRNETAFPIPISDSKVYGHLAALDRFSELDSCVKSSN